MVERGLSIWQSAKNALTDERDIESLIRIPNNPDDGTCCQNYIGLLHSPENLLHSDIELVAEKRCKIPGSSKASTSQKAQVPVRRESC